MTYMCNENIIIGYWGKMCSTKKNWEISKVSGGRGKIRTKHIFIDARKYYSEPQCIVY